MSEVPEQQPVLVSEAQRDDISRQLRIASTRLSHDIGISGGVVPYYEDFRMTVPNLLIASIRGVVTEAYPGSPDFGLCQNARAAEVGLMVGVGFGRGCSGVQTSRFETRLGRDIDKMRLVIGGRTPNSLRNRLSYQNNMAVTRLLKETPPNILEPYMPTDGYAIHEENNEIYEQSLGYVYGTVIEELLRRAIESSPSA